MFSSENALEFPASTTPTFLYESLSSMVTTALSIGNFSGNDSDISPGPMAGDWEPCDTMNPLFNCSVLEFLEYYQGPQMMPFLKAIMVSHLPF